MSLRRYGPIEMMSVPEGGLIWYWHEGWMISPAGRRLFQVSLEQAVEWATEDGGVVRRGMPL